MIKLIKKIFRPQKKDIVVYRGGKVYRFSSFTEAYPYMIH